MDASAAWATPERLAAVEALRLTLTEGEVGAWDALSGPLDVVVGAGAAFLTLVSPGRLVLADEPRLRKACDIADEWAGAPRPPDGVVLGRRGPGRRGRGVGLQALVDAMRGWAELEPRERPAVWSVDFFAVRLLAQARHWRRLGRGLGPVADTGQAERELERQLQADQAARRREPGRRRGGHR